MEWNSDAPLKLLAQMPLKFTKENLESIQTVIDNDKFICDSMLGRNLCGEYAPFCKLCDKSMAFQCAVAYIRMRQAEGAKLEIAIADDGAENKEQNFEQTEIAQTQIDTSALCEQTEITEISEVEELSAENTNEQTQIAEIVTENVEENESQPDLSLPDKEEKSETEILEGFDNGDTPIDGQTEVGAVEEQLSITEDDIQIQSEKKGIRIAIAKRKK